MTKPAKKFKARPWRPTDWQAGILQSLRDGAIIRYEGASGAMLVQPNGDKKSIDCRSLDEMQQKGLLVKIANTTGTPGTCYTFKGE